MKKTFAYAVAAAWILLMPELALAGFGTVYGQVTDESGEPILHAEVSTRFYNGDGSPLVVSVTVVEQGLYLLDMFVGSGFPVTASAAGYQPKTVYGVDIVEYGFTHVPFVLEELEPEPAEPSLWGVSTAMLRLATGSRSASFEVYGRELGVGTTVTATDYHGHAVDHEITTRIQRASPTTSRIVLRALPEAVPGRAYRLIIESEARGPLNLPMTVVVGD